MGHQPAGTNSTGKACGRCDRVRSPLRRGLCGACYERTRERQQAYGRWDPDRTPADPVREHVAACHAAGLSYRQLARHAEIHRSVLKALLHGKPGLAPPQWVSHATAEKILAVPVPESVTAVAAANAAVPSVGARRRLRALVADGWPQTALATELGVSLTNLGPVIHGDRTQITARRHRDIAELFTRMQLTPGPSQRARDYARARRWARSWQWDEDSIDDPKTRPNPAPYRRTIQPRPELGWAIHPTPSQPVPQTGRYSADALAVPVRRRIERTR